MLDEVDPVGKAPCDVQLHLILRLVRPIPAPALRLPAHRLRQGILPCQLRQIVPDAVLIKEVLRLELSRRYLTPQAEGDSGVDHGLPPQHLPVVVRRDVDVGEHLQIRQPADGGAGMAALKLRHPHLPGDLALFKVQAVLLAVPADSDVHRAAGVLGGAGAQTVEPQ